MGTLRDAIRAGIGTTLVVPGGVQPIPPSPESETEAHLRRMRARRMEEAELRRLEEEDREAIEERELQRLDREVRRAELLATRERLSGRSDPGASFAEALARSQQHVAELLLQVQQRSDDRFEKLMERVALLAAPKDEGSVASQVQVVKEIIGSVRDLIPQQPPSQPLTAADLVMIEKTRWEREDGLAARVLEDRRRQDERELRQIALGADAERNLILGQAVQKFGDVFGPAAQELLLSRLGGGGGTGGQEANPYASAAGSGQQRPTVQVECPACGLGQRHLLPEGEPMVRCPGCQAEFELVFDGAPAPSSNGNGHLPEG